MDIQTIVGQNVRTARLAAGLSQWDLVAKLELLPQDHGVDQSYISQLENGRKNPILTTLWCIAQALGVHIERLVTNSSALEISSIMKGNRSTRHWRMQAVHGSTSERRSATHSFFTGSLMY